jgi:hypothetical protein
VKPEARWLKVGLIGLVAVLLIGRWVSVTSADLMWASSLGVADAHFNMLRLSLFLLAWAFATAALWCIGNLLLVLRTIGSVHVPRRLANIEILEAIPRRFLLYAVVGVGLLLAIAMSHDAANWWTLRALSTKVQTIGLPDPILGNDASYYLFSLPWNRTLHGFAVLLSITMLGIVTVLYVAVGAIDVNARRIQISPAARRHIGGLLVAVAFSLFWGYRLEPAEYVAGIHGVPLDTVLTDVRLPTSQLLGALAVLAGISSAMWMVWDRLAVVAFGWVALATFSVTGHYVAPAVALSSRTPAERLLELEDSERSFSRIAFGLVGRESTLGFPTVDTIEPADQDLGRAAIWDPFALNVFLNSVTFTDSLIRVLDVSIARYPGTDAGSVPIALGVQDVDLVAVRQIGDDVSWEAMHKGEYATGRNAWAVRADIVSTDGKPVFIAEIDWPERTSAHPVPLNLSGGPIRYTSSASDYAVLENDSDDVHAVRVGGLLRRLALSWKLQSPRFLRPSSVVSTGKVSWNRAVTERLETYAPFLVFDQAYPIVVDRRMTWLAPGYVSIEGFPLTVSVRHNGRIVRYLRAGFLGLVDAHTGETRVFLMQDADPLSQAWAELVPGVIETTNRIPRSVFPLLRYPRNLFNAQLRALIALSTKQAGMRGFDMFHPMVAPADQSTFWWVGDSPVDSTRRLRLRAALERGDPPMLSAIVDGVVQGAGLRFDVFPLLQPLQIPGPSQVAGRVASELGPEPLVPGTVRTVPTPGGIVSIQAVYGTGTVGVEPPRLLDVFAGFDGGLPGLGRGPDLATAMERALAIPRVISDAGTEWALARRWFVLLDEARRGGRWEDFGEAYNALVRLFGLPADSNP